MEKKWCHSKALTGSGKVIFHFMVQNDTKVYLWLKVKWPTEKLIPCFLSLIMEYGSESHEWFPFVAVNQDQSMKRLLLTQQHTPHWPGWLSTEFCWTMKGGDVCWVTCHVSLAPLTSRHVKCLLFPNLTYIKMAE